MLTPGPWRSWRMIVIYSVSAAVSDSERTTRNIADAREMTNVRRPTMLYIKVQTAAETMAENRAEPEKM